MSVKHDVLILAHRYLKKHNINGSLEQLFIDFKQLLELHEEFEQYLKESKLKFKLNTMKRDKRLKEKRKLFVQWYFKINQNKQTVKESYINLSELIFASTKTVQNDLLKETTALS